MNKKRLFGFLIILVIIFFIDNYQLEIASHAPSRMVLEYNFETQSLSILIEHMIGAGEEYIHYVENVKTWKNDILMEEETYTSQFEDIFTIEYNISAVHDDVLKVAAICCIGGELTQTLTVIDPSYTPPETNTPLLSNIGYILACLPIITLFVIKSTAKSKQKK